jgi:hypothetical protein
MAEKFDVVSALLDAILDGLSRHESFLDISLRIFVISAGCPNPQQVCHGFHP